MAKRKTAAVAGSTQVITIAPPNIQLITVEIKGESPLLQHAFSKKGPLMQKMAEGDTSKKAKRKPRDFDADFEDAKHVSSEGWTGVPASAIRNACIDVCRVAGYQMTKAKMSIFVVADGFDRRDGMPLIRLHASKPERSEMAARNANGSIDIRVRPLWRDWVLRPRIRFDADQFTLSDVMNLLERAGMQCGIGEGRHYSKESNGMGFGEFRVKRAA